MDEIKLLSGELGFLNAYLDETWERLDSLECVSSSFMDRLNLFMEDVCFYMEGLDEQR